MLLLVTLVGMERVFNAVLQDHTGVITICAWGQHADELSTRLNQLEQANESEDVTRYWLRVELFAINQMKGSPTEVCPIAVMQTIPPAKGKGVTASTSSSRNTDVVDAAFGTQFSIVEAKDAETPNPSAENRLRSSVGGVVNFEVLGQLRPPFRVNIAGVVADVSLVQPTIGGSGKPVRTMVLSDPSGCQVTIRQLGSAADDPDIQRGRNVVAYFVSGTKAWNGGEAGSLWTYEGSYIQVGSLAASVPSLSREVSILAE